MSEILFIVNIVVAIYAIAIFIINYKALRITYKLSYVFVCIAALSSALNVVGITIVCAVICMICMCYDMCKTGNYRVKHEDDEDIQNTEE